MKKKAIILVFLSYILLLSLTGCVPGDGTYSSEYQAGFFWGVWHGWIAPVSLVWGFFNRDIRIYELNNVGWWYDFGFYIAVISGFGGASIFRHKRNRD